MSTNTQTQVAARQSLDALLEEVTRGKDSLAAFLPANTSPDRFMALARRAVLEQPALSECSAASVLRALRECALSGLELDGKMSTLIVRKSKQGRPTATWDATYRGMTSLALSSGIIRGVEAQVVREADDFSVELGSHAALMHRPRISGARGDVIAAYAIAELSSGAKVIELLTGEDLRRIRALSPAGDRGPWGPWDDEMARKSALRRLLKKLPAGVVPRLLLGATPAPTELRARENASAPTVLPEDAFALECHALERLDLAGSVPELDAAWAQAQVDHQQRGAPIPLAVEARWRELREVLSERQ
jgi:recombination protein RecT